MKHLQNAMKKQENEKRENLHEKNCSLIAYIYNKFDYFSWGILHGFQS